MKQKWKDNPENREKIKELHRLNYLKHREKILLKYQNNKDQMMCKIKQWRLKNSDHVKKYQNEYIKKLTKTSANYKISMALRHRFKNAITKQFKTTSVLKLIGCDILQLREHLEKQFQPGMTWSNHGEWHIDHIKPCCCFDLTSVEQQKECFNYKNLQPLWAKDNLSKNGKYNE